MIKNILNILKINRTNNSKKDDIKEKISKMESNIAFKKGVLDMYNILYDYDSKK